MGTPTWSETDFPFGTPVSPATGPLLTSDLNISKNNPAVEFTGTENNAVYSEIREQGGDTYFATNAVFTTGWVPVNNANPAYAMILKGTGQLLRAWCAAGTSPIVWTTLVTIDPQGAIGTTPATFTTGAVALSLAPTWNMSSTVATGLLLNVVDTASNAASKFLDLQIAGTSKFTITKAGAITVGTFKSSGINTMTAGVATDTPLTISGTAGQAVDILDLTLTSSGQLALVVGNTGNITIAKTASSANLIFGTGTSAQTGAITFISNQIQFTAQSSTALAAQINADGTLQLQPTINATNTLGRVAPCYLSNGATVASTFHIVKDVVNATTASTNVPLTGAAAFANATNYSILVWDEATPGTLINPSASATGSFTFPSTNGHTYAFLLMGF